MFDEEEKGSYNFERLWVLSRRGRWWILLPLFLCWITVWGISWFLPTTYESEALIQIEQQKVPEQYVLSNVSVNLEERLESMTQQILSRTRLQSIINQFHLVDSVEQMRKNIKIDLVQPPGRPAELTAFKINYTASSPELAQQVNHELTSLFINESLKSQQQLSESTTSFLGNQLTEARQKLEEQEAKVRAFKARHLGDLPSQLQSNVEILSGLHAQLESTQRALDGARQQKLYLESQLQQYGMTKARDGELGPVSAESLQNELLELRSRLVDLRSRYQDGHPDIVAIKTRVAQVEKLIAGLEASNAADPNGSTPQVLSGPAERQILSQLKANDLEIHNYQRQESNIATQISNYQARLNMTPETEQELADISRGYEESKANYNSLLQKQNQSQLATNLEQRQQGEQFRILDPPSLPDKPKSPNHLLLSLGGLALGFVMGIGLLALRELTNARVWQEEDLGEIVHARVLVRVPHLDTPREVRSRRVLRFLEVVAVSTMAVLIVAGNLYALYKG